MTPQEDALMAYLRTIAQDPRVRAAGWSLLKLKAAIAECMGDHVPAVLAHAAKNGGVLAEHYAKQVVQHHTRAAFSGVPAGVRDGLTGVAEVAVGEVFTGLKSWVAGIAAEREKVRAKRRG